MYLMGKTREGMYGDGVDDLRAQSASNIQSKKS